MAKVVVFYYGLSLGHFSLLRQDKLSGATGGLGQPGSVTVADAMT